MRKINPILVTFFIIGFLFISCNNDKISTDEILDNTQIDNPVNNFVWQGMNSWYNWQPNVSDLLDEKDADLNDYYTYLNGFTTPEALFESLLYDKDAVDRFSWFIEDYVEQQKSFQGISVSTGLRRSTPIAIGDNQVIIYAQYVSLESPAYSAGIRRGDIINAIDNEIMNETNYASVINKLYSGNTIVVSTAKEENGVLTKLNDFTITPAEFGDNPIHFKKIFNDVNGKKVGYLVYNGFRSSYNDELNDVFSYFKNENITELILDLRLNGGGSVLTSSYLASMIYANAGTDTFAELRFNDKHSDENGVYSFFNNLTIYNVDGSFEASESVNRLNTISELYVLTSGGTASASEMIINGLRAFIPVKVIGETTYGKNVGSITLYDDPDSDFTDVGKANSNHNNAMQPIVFQIYNKNGESDYTQGFLPDIEVQEYKSWKNILPFGDENEVVLKTALNAIKGLTAKSSRFKDTQFKRLDIQIPENKFEKEMYIEGDFFKK